MVTLVQANDHVPAKIVRVRAAWCPAAITIQCSVGSHPHLSVAKWLQNVMEHGPLDWWMSLPHEQQSTRINASFGRDNVTTRWIPNDCENNDDDDNSIDVKIGLFSDGVLWNPSEEMGVLVQDVKEITIDVVNYGGSWCSFNTHREEETHILREPVYSVRKKRKLTHNHAEGRLGVQEEKKEESIVGKAKRDSSEDESSVEESVVDKVPQAEGPKSIPEEAKSDSYNEESSLEESVVDKVPVTQPESIPEEAKMDSSDESSVEESVVDKVPPAETSNSPSRGIVDEEKEKREEGREQVGPKSNERKMEVDHAESTRGKDSETRNEDRGANGESHHSASETGKDDGVAGGNLAEQKNNKESERLADDESSVNSSGSHGSSSSVSSSSSTSSSSSSGSSSSDSSVSKPRETVTPVTIPVVCRPPKEVNVVIDNAESREPSNVDVLPGEENDSVRANSSRETSNAIETEDKNASDKEEPPKVTQDHADASDEAQETEGDSDSDSSDDGSSSASVASSEANKVDDVRKEGPRKELVVEAEIDMAASEKSDKASSNRVSDDSVSHSGSAWETKGDDVAPINGERKHEDDESSSSDDSSSSSGSSSSSSSSSSDSSSNDSSASAPEKTVTPVSIPKVSNVGQRRRPPLVSAGRKIIITPNGKAM